MGICYEEIEFFFFQQHWQFKEEQDVHKDASSPKQSTVVNVGTLKLSVQLKKLNMNRETVKQILSNVALDTLAMRSITKMDCPSYLSNSVPCDLRLFTKLKNNLQNRFGDISNIQQCMHMSLKVILENLFQECFHLWHHHLIKCMASQEEYFEGDSSRMTK